MGNRDHDDLLTSRQVAELTGWSITSINRWALSGELPADRKLPGRTGSYLFRRSVVLDNLRQRDEANALRSSAA